MQIYRTGSNESIYDIAAQFGVSPIKVAENNELEIRGRLPKGREVLVLTPSRTYNAKGTDTLGRIAERFKTTKESLMRLNPELGGREKLYSGQLLTIKESTPSYGMISTNGYLYASTPRERLIAIIPYLSYVTVCSAVYKEGHVHSLYPSEETVELIKSLGRVPMLRIYLTELPTESEVGGFASSIGILAASGGFAGITLSCLNTMTKDTERLDSLVFTVRRMLMENDLLLFVEGDLEEDTSYMEYADAGILTYDKLHVGNAPSFADGERAALEKFAYAGESSRTFLEISSFAYSGGKYIEKREGARLCDKRRAETVYDDEKMLKCASFGKHKRREILFESLENTKAKLELVSELGFMGISFDIGRVCIPDLMIAASMFDVISYPVMTPRVGG
ncbi:MAG: LysM peptidoglycan-binding domain-containing protein [Clostridia bacterium]|nr:LysM peptidoglycan-binding domain-containing protein [Clostridia bacterium]